ncbi:MAG: hypothetical protein WC326_12305 [Candidatus Delongbacteria bacterium]
MRNQPARLSGLTLALLGWLGLLPGAGCERRVPLAANFPLGETATVVTFAHPVLGGAHRALCFRFERPEDARLARELEIVLLTADGGEDSLRAAWDQTGEASLCLHDSSALRPIYTAARIRAPRALQVRRLDWGGSE